MKVIFLDIDGVLNTSDYCNRRPWGKESFSNKVQHLMINPILVLNLNDLVVKSGAVCVINSSWRWYNSSKSIMGMLKKQGFCGQVIDSTPINNGIRSKDPITDWLLENPKVTNMVIIDDCDHYDHFRDYLVQTSWGKGLTKEHVEMALKILRKPLPLSCMIH